MDGRLPFVAHRPALLDGCVGGNGHANNDEDSGSQLDTFLYVNRGHNGIEINQIARRMLGHFEHRKQNQDF